MTEREYLSTYNPGAFPPVAVTVDIVVLAVRDAALHVLLARRGEHPFAGKLALPGVFVGADEELHDAARRAVRAKAGVDAAVRQFHAYGGIGRDPRMRVISVAYMAVVTADQLAPVLDDDHQLLRLDGSVARAPSGRKQPLPFDHAAIIAGALDALRADLDQSPFSLGLLPPEFSLRELQEMHEAVRGQALNKPAFRKRLLESGRLEPTGRRETDKGFRPAELYRVRENQHADR
jgi:8-oxo-dGTP diphosphatase